MVGGWWLVVAGGEPRLPPTTNHRPPTTDHDLTIAAIHRVFAQKRSTLTSILDRLEERGLIVCESDSRDRRTFVVKLTREGRPLARRVLAHLEAFEASVLKAAGRHDLEGFYRVLDALDQTAPEE